MEKGRAWIRFPDQGDFFVPSSDAILCLLGHDQTVDRIDFVLAQDELVCFQKIIRFHPFFSEIRREFLNERLGKAILSSLRCLQPPMPAVPDRNRNRPSHQNCLATSFFGPCSSRFSCLLLSVVFLRSDLYRKSGCWVLDAILLQTGKPP